MTKLIFTLPLVLISFAQADEYKTIHVPAPIAVNKPSANPNSTLDQKLADMNTWIHTNSGPFVLPYSAEVLKAGKLYAEADLTAMLNQDAAALVNSTHCEISDAFSLYQPSSSLKGDLLLHVYNTTAVNVMAWGNASDMTQVLGQTYFAVDSKDKSELLGMINCYTFLHATSAAEAQANLDAYNAAGAYAPLTGNLEK